MTIRSTTKKRLLELDLPEDYAVQLATDRTVSDVEKMTPAQIAQVTNCSGLEASRIHEKIVSKDAHEIERRMKYRDCTNLLHMSMRSVEGDILNLADGSGRIDVNRLLREYRKEGGGEHETLQEDVFVEMFRDDMGKATNAAVFLIAKKIDVPIAVISGFMVQFVSMHHVKITLGGIREEDMDGVVDGLSSHGRLDDDVAKFLRKNKDLAKIAEGEICKGDVVVERFPMKAVRSKEIFDLHPDDIRWPSRFNERHGTVIHRGCTGVLCVEFEGTGRPRAFIHESFCMAMPTNRPVKRRKKSDFF